MATIEELRQRYEAARDARQAAQRIEEAAELSLLDAEGDPGRRFFAAWLRASLAGDWAGMEAANLAMSRDNLTRYGPDFFLSGPAKDLGLHAVAPPPRSPLPLLVDCGSCGGQHLAPSCLLRAEAEADCQF
jgi:hypothetical protein